MSQVTVLDASVLIAAMQPADEHHAAAVTFLRREALTAVLVAHPITLAESAVGAAERGLLPQLRRAYDGLGITVATPSLDEPWHLARLRVETRLPIPDCCVLSTAEEVGAPLATFDSRLGAAARARDLVAPLA